MMRVCRIATIIITSGGPEKRMHYFEQITKKIEYHKIEVSKLAQLINILRTGLGNKPLSSVMKDDSDVLKEALQEMVALERIKRLELESKSDPKKRLALIMYKAKLKMDLKAKQEALAEKNKDENK